MMPVNAETQSWVTKTVWQRIPGRWAHNSKTPTTITCPVDTAERSTSSDWRTRDVDDRRRSAVCNFLLNRSVDEILKIKLWEFKMVLLGSEYVWSKNKQKIDWLIEQCFTSPPTQYRLYGRRFLQVKRPKQQNQSTEGESCKEKQHKKHKENRNYTYACTHKIVDEYSIQL